MDFEKKYQKDPGMNRVKEPQPTARMSHSHAIVDTLVILGRYRALLVGTWWYWVSIGRYWLILGGTGSV